MIHPKPIDAWKLNPQALYVLDGNTVVRELMKQLHVPNLFAQASVFEAMQALVAFDNHPTHWIVVRLWQGLPAYSPNHSIHKLVRSPDPNGLLFQAIPKSTTSRAKMEIELARDAREMEADRPFEFQRLPLR